MGGRFHNQQISRVKNCCQEGMSWSAQLVTQKGELTYASLSVEVKGTFLENSTKINFTAAVV